MLCQWWRKSNLKIKFCIYHQTSTVLSQLYESRERERERGKKAQTLGQSAWSSEVDWDGALMCWAVDVFTRQQAAANGWQNHSRSRPLRRYVTQVLYNRRSSFVEHKTVPQILQNSKRNLAAVSCTFNMQQQNSEHAWGRGVRRLTRDMAALPKVIR